MKKHPHRRHEAAGKSHRIRHEKGKRLPIRMEWVAAAAVLCVVAAGAILLQPRECPNDTATCPDGSTAGRALPDCAFQCPKMALKTMSLSTDRQLYKSRERMWVNITVESEKKSDAAIYVHGITVKGRDFISVRTNQTFDEGMNEIAMDYYMPPCTSCSGISAGTYTITAEIITEAEKRTMNTTIELRQ